MLRILPYLPPGFSSFFTLKLCAGPYAHCHAPFCLGSCLTRITTARARISARPLYARHFSLLVPHNCTYDRLCAVCAGTLGSAHLLDTSPPVLPLSTWTHNLPPTRLRIALLRSFCTLSRRSASRGCWTHVYSPCVRCCAFYSALHTSLKPPHLPLAALGADCIWFQDTLGSLPPTRISLYKFRTHPSRPLFRHAPHHVLDGCYTSHLAYLCCAPPFLGAFSSLITPRSRTFLSAVNSSRSFLNNTGPRRCLPWLLPLI